ncbi:hypothetical protein [Microcystis sp. BLCC-F210]|uniref:hypothetical protein n=1 Tax=Microcystis sp. BLCC-F210 TaxID=3342751 RepID=UPI0035C9271C
MGRPLRARRSATLSRAVAGGSGEIELKPQNPKTPIPKTCLLSPISYLLTPNPTNKLFQQTLNKYFAEKGSSEVPQ